MLDTTLKMWSPLNTNTNSRKTYLNQNKVTIYPILSTKLAMKPKSTGWLLHTIYHQIWEIFFHTENSNITFALQPRHWLYRGGPWDSERVRGLIFYLSCNMCTMRDILYIFLYFVLCIILCLYLDPVKNETYGRSFWPNSQNMRVWNRVVKTPSHTNCILSNVGYYAAFLQKIHHKHGI